jgi:uncharacterized protein DUF3592
MRRYSMPNRDAWARLRPKNDHDWHQIRVLGGYLALIAIFVAAIFFFKHRHREDLENNWMSTVAVIEDVRPEQIGVIDTPISGAILYQVTILVKYKLDGGNQERWITVDQRPVSLSGAMLQAFRWKGKQCTVRWKPSNPSKVLAEVS